ncbi:MAG: hypothetical protein BGO78_02455 [Chloroflexi bacterium 44-23]|nr:MAG: hypothetical protein BGO78_02455 [Chloroflexi bacterium 44-23]
MRLAGYDSLRAACDCVSGDCVLSDIGPYRFNVPLFHYQTSDLKIEARPEQIALGGQKAVLCADCHSSNQKDLDGSPFNFLEGSPMGDLYAPILPRMDQREIRAMGK